MMCLACEQDGLWLAYLQRRGLITADGFVVQDPPFLAVAADAAPAQDVKKEESAARSADERFSCDDPTAAAADLKLLQTRDKPE
jgi:hypothetical protein